jgi:hypothetical protein
MPPLLCAASQRNGYLEPDVYVLQRTNRPLVCTEFPVQGLVRMAQQINPPNVQMRDKTDAPRFEPEPATWSSRLFWALLFVAVVAFCVAYFLLSTVNLWL